MRLLVTGGAGVLGRAFRPLAEAEGHQVSAPGRAELDLFDPAAVGARMRGVDAMLHLATRIRPLEAMGQPEAWRENDRLRAEAGPCRRTSRTSSPSWTFPRAPSSQPR